MAAPPPVEAWTSDDEPEGDSIHALYGARPQPQPEPEPEPEPEPSSFLAAVRTRSIPPRIARAAAARAQRPEYAFWDVVHQAAAEIQRATRGHLARQWCAAAASTFPQPLPLPAAAARRARPPLSRPLDRRTLRPRGSGPARSSPRPAGTWRAAAG
eukprot:COSAG04_NODE_670_length_11367_cov_62.932109_3_plen_156_part_00